MVVGRIALHARFFSTFANGKLKPSFTEQGPSKVLVRAFSFKFGLPCVLSSIFSVLLVHWSTLSLADDSRMSTSRLYSGPLLVHSLEVPYEGNTPVLDMPRILFSLPEGEDGRPQIFTLEAKDNALVLTRLNGGDGRPPTEFINEWISLFRSQNPQVREAASFGPVAVDMVSRLESESGLEPLLQYRRLIATFLENPSVDELRLSDDGDSYTPTEILEALIRRQDRRLYGRTQMGVILPPQWELNISYVIPAVVRSNQEAVYFDNLPLESQLAVVTFRDVNDPANTVAAILEAHEGGSRLVPLNSDQAVLLAETLQSSEAPPAASEFQALLSETFRLADRNTRLRADPQNRNKPVGWHLFNYTLTSPSNASLNKLWNLLSELWTGELVAQPLILPISLEDLLVNLSGRQATIRSLSRADSCSANIRVLNIRLSENTDHQAD